MTIMITRLLTGEEILGELTIIDNSSVRVDNPTLVAAMRNPQSGNIDVHMAPFMPLSSQTHVLIRTENVLCQYEPVTEVVNKYNTLFGSGIIIPTNTGIQSV
jgi:hypothetical protein